MNAVWFRALGAPLDEASLAAIDGYLTGLRMGPPVLRPCHPFLHKHALYCAGRWPLGVYDDAFVIF